MQWHVDLSFIFNQVIVFFSVKNQKNYHRSVLNLNFKRPINCVSIENQGK